MAGSEYPVSGPMLTRLVPFGQFDLVALSYFQVEMLRDWNASEMMGCLCFPCREYTEDGQVKTERRYSYSEYQPPTLSALPQPTGGRVQNQVLGSLGAGPWSPACLSIQ